MLVCFVDTWMSILFICFSLMTYLFIFIVIKIIIHYLFDCLHIVVNIMEFYATVIQVRCLASFKTWFYPPFTIPVPSQKYDSVYSFVWCVCYWWGFVENTHVWRKYKIKSWYLWWVYLAIDFAIWLWNYCFEFFSQFSIFVILLFIYAQIWKRTFNNMRIETHPYYWNIIQHCINMLLCGYMSTV